VDALTLRAERALLGAMIEDPALVGRLRVRPSEFADGWHAAVYGSIRAARQAPFHGTDGWRAAILQAGPSLTPADLDALAGACPFVPHGLAYGVMVVQAWARRHLDESAHRLRARGRQLDRDSRQVMASDEPAGLEMAGAADHMRRVAGAIHSHARELSPRMPDPSSGRRYGASPERVRREEAVLAGLLHQDPERNADILRILPDGGFTNPHRKEIYQVLTAMHLAGKAVDELTLDWELATQGVPLDARQSGGAVRDDQTYAMRLARLEYGYEEPVTAARELSVEYGQSRSGHPAGSARRGTPGARQMVRARGDAPAERVPGRPVLRLVQSPPEAGGPTGRGPQQAR
jgi:hypothetical protein